MVHIEYPARALFSLFRILHAEFDMMEVDGSV